MARDYTREYELEKRRGESGTGSGSENARRHRDRRKALALGLVKPRDDLDHKVPLSKGGSDRPSNFRDEPASVNRSFPRTSTGAMVANHPKKK